MSLRRILMIALTGMGMTACSNDPAKDPNERSASELYRMKGIQYMENGQLNVALQDLKRSVELDGRSSEAHNALAVLYERLNQPTDAEEHFSRALSLDEKNTGAANNYGRFLCTQGKYQQAMKLFQEVIDSKLYPSPWLALTNAGLCARSSGLPEEAESYLRKALETNPEFAPALLELAKLSLDKGQHLSARGFLQRFESVSQHSAESLWTGVQIEKALGNSKSAAEYLRNLRSRFPDYKEANQVRGPHTPLPH